MNIQKRNKIVRIIQYSFETDQEKFSIANNALELIKIYSSKSKMVFHSKGAILKDYFISKKDLSKIEILDSLFTFIDKHLIAKNIPGNFDVSILGSNNTYVEISRSDIASRKGKSILYPILNFINENNYNSELPIDLRLNLEEYKIYDYYYFQVLTDRGGGTHRTRGLCASLGLLENCKIKMEYITYYTSITIKEIMDIVFKFIDTVLKMNLIKTLHKNDGGYDNDDEYCLTLENNCIFIYKSKKIEDFLNFVNDEHFETLIDDLILLNFKVINYKDQKSIIIDTNCERININLMEKTCIFELFNKLAQGYITGNSFGLLKQLRFGQKSLTSYDDVKLIGEVIACRQANLERKTNTKNLICKMTEILINNFFVFLIPLLIYLLNN